MERITILNDFEQSIILDENQQRENENKETLNRGNNYKGVRTH